MLSSVVMISGVVVSRSSVLVSVGGWVVVSFDICRVVIVMRVLYNIVSEPEIGRYYFCEMLGAFV